MEALVYEDSPLASYLEGEGQGAEDWVPQEVERQPQPPIEPSTNDFAPRGPTKFQERIRDKIPAPLRVKKRETLARFREACSVAISARIGKGDNDRFLEQFRYLIVASQLLNEQSPPSYSTITGLLANHPPQDVPSDVQTTSFGLEGVLITTAASFAIVALLHWARSRPRLSWDARKVVVLLFLLLSVAVSFFIFAKRQWLRDLRCRAVDVASVLVGNAQSLDAAASASVVLIQEVELVSRGYRLSTPMPPVSRMEEQNQTRRCSKLRRILSECLIEMLQRYLEAKQKVQSLVAHADLVKYYDIYDISPEELQSAEFALTEVLLNDKTSLRSLRLLFTKLYAVRKSVLCCLLALPADGGDVDITKWTIAVEEMQRLATASGACLQRLSDILNEQDRDVLSPSPRAKPSPSRDRHRAQLRRLSSLSQGIRGLQAKMHLIREASDACVEGSDEDADLSSTLLSQYESIGADLRSLLQEWEAGKSALLANLEKPDRTDRISRPSSILRSPASPTSSIGGSTAVDGSPAAALRALNGETQLSLSPDRDLDDEEIFEAVALPRKRYSMTRDERIARMKEDRARQAAARERAEANTNMLRELETVIKLRPRGKTGARITSI
ncbi:hypothetical protein VTO42DRAFT_2532 [Malbranchea cinnamomea]